MTSRHQGGQGIRGDRYPSGDHEPAQRDASLLAVVRRRAAVTLLVIRALSEYLGHHDAGFTLQTYVHLMPDAADRTRQAIDAAYTRALTARRRPRGVRDDRSSRSDAIP